MAAPQTDFNNTWKCNRPPIGEPTASICSNLFVLNSNFVALTGAASSDAADVYGLFNGDHSNGANVYPAVNTTNWTHLDIYLVLYAPTGVETITGAPVLRAHGQLPIGSVGPQRWPSEINTAIPNPSLTPTTMRSMWVPQGTESRTPGTLDLTMPITNGTIIGKDGSKTLTIFDCVSVALQGTIRSLVTVYTAGTVSDAAARGLVVGRFSSP